MENETLENEKLQIIDYLLTSIYHQNANIKKMGFKVFLKNN